MLASSLIIFPFVCFISGTERWALAPQLSRETARGSPLRHCALARELSSINDARKGTRSEFGNNRLVIWLSFWAVQVYRLQGNSDGKIQSGAEV